jgi:hypothetical protein
LARRLAMKAAKFAVSSNPQALLAELIKQNLKMVTDRVISEQPKSTIRQFIAARPEMPAAIAHAKANFHAPNVEYRCADIRTDMPEGSFDNVVWDAAIEHFTEEEIGQILKKIKERLAPDGNLSGYTLVEKATGKSLSYHEYEFKSKEELAAVLKKYFDNVFVFENVSRDYLEERGNLYFFASDGVLPFDLDWSQQVRL